MIQNPDFSIAENIEFKYKVRKSKKAKYVSLKVSPTGGLEVVIPFLYRNFDLEKFLYSKRNWIKEKLDKVETIKSKQLLFGRELVLEEQFNLFNDFSVLLKFDKLIISKPENYKLNALEIFDEWLFNQAEKYIPSRVNSLARKFEFDFNKVKIKNQKTRWGSCSSKKNLSFNYRLMSFNKRVIDYVIIHELCHLKEMNHSPKFWNLVEEIMPDYKIHRRTIRNFK